MFFSWCEFQRKSGNDFFCNLVLNTEYVVDLFIVALSPKVMASFGVNKLRIYSDTVSRFADRAFKDVVYSEFFGDLCCPQLLTLKHEGRFAGLDRKIRNL